MNNSLNFWMGVVNHKKIIMLKEDIALYRVYKRKRVCCQLLAVNS